MCHHCHIVLKGSSFSFFSDNSQVCFQWFQFICEQPKILPFRLKKQNGGGVCCCSVDAERGSCMFPWNKWVWDFTPECTLLHGSTNISEMANVSICPSNSKPGYCLSVHNTRLVFRNPDWSKSQDKFFQIHEQCLVSFLVFCTWCLKFFYTFKKCAILFSSDPPEAGSKLVIPLTVQR